MNLPKIIHSLAPSDKTKWHPIWEECLFSWFREFDEKEFKHVMWNDDQIENLIREDYREYYQFFIDLPEKVMKIDVSRLLILHKFGGIYHDMDYFCYKNFWPQASEAIHSTDLKMVFVGNNYGLREEILQNSLLISEKNNPFLIFVVDTTRSMFSQLKKFNVLNNVLKRKNPAINYITASIPLQVCLQLFVEKDEDIVILNSELFNPRVLDYNDKMFCKHFCTGVWHSNESKNENLEYRLPENYDFYKNYLIQDNYEY